MFFVYILRCADNSLYTGYTTDVKRRFDEHKSDKKRGAKYTRSRTPVSVEAVWKTENRSDAMRLEAMIKKLGKSDKEEIIKFPQKLFDKCKGRLDESVRENVEYENCR